jgi:hypothetical protein
VEQWNNGIMEYCVSTPPFHHSIIPILQYSN